MLYSGLRKLLFLLIAFFFIVGGYAIEPPKYEVRGAWVTTVYGLDWPSKAARSAPDEERQRRELTELLDALEVVGINTIFLQVRGRGDLIYPSAVEPMSASFTARRDRRLGYDPLAFAIEEAHKRGMALHAWLVALPLGGDKYVRSLPKWSYAKAHRNQCIRYKGEWYMDPALPQTSEHLRSIARELVTRYNIDGVHLDYIRYPDRPKQFPDQKKYKNQHEKGETLDEWREENIQKIVEAIYGEVKKHDPNILVSAATIGNYREVDGAPRVGWTALESVHQDPKSWADAGVIDFIVPMMYQGSTFGEPFLKDWELNISAPIVAGLGAYRTLPREGNWDASKIIHQTQVARAADGFAGVAYFRSEQLASKKKRLGDLLKTELGRHPALPYPPARIDGRVAAKEFGLEEDEEGIHISWQRCNDAPTPFFIYLKSDGAEPNTGTGEDLYLVTTDNKVHIPKKLYGGKENYLTIVVGSYTLKGRVESAENYRTAFHYLPEKDDLPLEK